MSNVQRLRDVISEYRKANKELDKRITKAEETLRQNRQEQKETHSHPS